MLQATNIQLAVDFVSKSTANAQKAKLSLILILNKQVSDGPELLFTSQTVKQISKYIGNQQTHKSQKINLVPVCVKQISQIMKNVISISQLITNLVQNFARNTCDKQSCMLTLSASHENICGLLRLLEAYSVNTGYVECKLKEWIDNCCVATRGVSYFVLFAGLQILAQN